VDPSDDRGVLAAECLRVLGRHTQRRTGQHESGRAAASGCGLVRHSQHVEAERFEAGEQGSGARLELSGVGVQHASRRRGRSTQGGFQRGKGELVDPHGAGQRMAT
jgi:hypothetical protein